jgi:hypothetical protein
VHFLDFERSRGPEAEVRPPSERDVLGGVGAMEVERARCDEVRFVMVGGRE